MQQRVKQVNKPVKNKWLNLITCIYIYTYIYIVAANWSLSNVLFKIVTTFVIHSIFYRIR